jgi:hypothetical protein
MSSDTTQQSGSHEGEHDFDQLIETTSPALLKQAAANPELTEDLALALLKRSDLSGDVIEQLSKHPAVGKSRKLRRAVVEHQKTPRHVSVPILRHLFTFELMHVALTPCVPADVKRAAEEVLTGRLDSIPSGARLTLARRASGRIAGELLRDREPRVMKAALDNARLTEAILIRALNQNEPSPSLVQAACHHPKWSGQRDVRIALLRCEHTPLARALEFARSLPGSVVDQVLKVSRLSEKVKTCLLRELKRNSS